MSNVTAATKLAKVVLLVDRGYMSGPLEVVINRGAIHHLKMGDRFLVVGIGPHIYDPATGEHLGKLELVRGRGEIVHVQERIATLRNTERRRTRPARRIVREGSSIGPLSRGLGLITSSSNVIEEELAPEAEMPFESVQPGDLAKPI